MRSRSDIVARDKDAYLRPIDGEGVHVHKIEPCSKGLVEGREGITQMLEVLDIGLEGFGLVDELGHRGLDEAKAMGRIGVCRRPREPEERALRDAAEGRAVVWLGGGEWHRRRLTRANTVPNSDHHDLLDDRLPDSAQGCRRPPRMARPVLRVRRCASLPCRPLNILVSSFHSTSVGQRRIICLGNASMRNMATKSVCFCAYSIRKSHPSLQVSIRRVCYSLAVTGWP